MPLQSQRRRYPKSFWPLISSHLGQGLLYKRHIHLDSQNSCGCGVPGLSRKLIIWRFFLPVSGHISVWLLYFTALRYIRCPMNQKMNRCEDVYLIAYYCGTGRYILRSPSEWLWGLLVVFSFATDKKQWISTDFCWDTPPHDACLVTVILVTHKNCVVQWKFFILDSKKTSQKVTKFMKIQNSHPCLVTNSHPGRDFYKSHFATDRFTMGSSIWPPECTCGSSPSVLLLDQQSSTWCFTNQQLHSTMLIAL